MNAILKEEPGKPETREPGCRPARWSGSCGVAWRSAPKIASNRRGSWRGRSRRRSPTRCAGATVTLLRGVGADPAGPGARGAHGPHVPSGRCSGGGLVGGFDKAGMRARLRLDGGLVHRARGVALRAADRRREEARYRSQETAARLSESRRACRPFRAHGDPLGEVVQGEGRVEGLARATGSACAPWPRPRQVLLTRAAFDLSRRAAKGDDALDERVVWVAHGPYLIQGLEEPVETFEVGLEGRQSPGPRRPGARDARRADGQRNRTGGIPRPSDGL